MDVAFFLSPRLQLFRFSYAHTCPLRSLALGRNEASHSSFLKSEGKGYVEVKLVGQLAGRRCGNLGGNRFMLSMSRPSDSIGCTWFCNVLHVAGAKCTFASLLVVPLSWSKSMTFLKELWPDFEARIGHGLFASAGGMKGITYNHVPIYSGWSPDCVGAWPTQAA